MIGWRIKDFDGYLFSRSNHNIRVKRGTRNMCTSCQVGAMYAVCPAVRPASVAPPFICNQRIADLRCSDIRHPVPESPLATCGITVVATARPTETKVNRHARYNAIDTPKRLPPETDRYAGEMWQAIAANYKQCRIILRLRSRVPYKHPLQPDAAISAFGSS